MFCGNCGNELREGARFCPKCGAITRLGRQQNQPSAEPEQAMPPVIPEPEPVIETEPAQEPAGTNTPAEPAIEEDAAPAPRQQVRQRPAAGKAKPAVRLKAMPVKPAQEAQPAQQEKPARPVSPPSAPVDEEPAQQPAAPAQSSFLETGAARFAPAVGSVKDALGGGSVQCGSCGTRLKAGTKFCPECGAFQGEIKQESQSSAQALASEDVKVVVKRISIIAVPVVVIVLALIIAMTMGGQQDRAASPTVTPFSDTTSNSNGLSTPTALPTEGLSFIPPNGLPEGEIWDHVVEATSYGSFMIDSSYIVPAFRCTQEMLDNVLMEVTERKPDVTNYIFDGAGIFSADTKERLSIYGESILDIWGIYMYISTGETENDVYTPMTLNTSAVGLLLTKENNSYYIKKAVNNDYYLENGYYQAIDNILSRPSVTVETLENDVIALYQELIIGLMNNYPMKESVPLTEAPTGQWLCFSGPPYSRLELKPDYQIYINSIENDMLTFSATTTIHSQDSPYDGERYTIEQSIKLEPQNNSTAKSGTFTYTDPWGNVFEESLLLCLDNGYIAVSPPNLIEHGLQNSPAFGLTTGRYYPVSSIFS